MQSKGLVYLYVQFSLDLRSILFDASRLPRLDLSKARMHVQVGQSRSNFLVEGEK